MVWLPNLPFVLQTFDLLKKLPECSDLLKATCINPKGVLGILDKVEHGLPFQEISFWMQAAILMHDLISYHYFTDGNKRIGFIMMVIFLKKNGYSLQASEDDKVTLTLKIAQGRLEMEEIAGWIQENSRKQQCED